MSESIDFILREDKLNDKGLCPIYLRLIKERKVAYISLGGIFYIRNSDWDSALQKVKKGHPNAARMNNQLARLLAEATDIILDLNRAGNQYSVQDIKKNLIGEKRHDSFIDYFKGYLERLTHEEKVGTLTKAKTVLNNLQKYLDGNDLRFDQLDIHFLEKYEEYHRTKNPPSAINTIHSNLKLIRKLVNDAIREGIIPVDRNPFSKYKLKREEKEKNIYLEPDELKRLEDADLDHDHRLKLIRDMFVFSVYAAGIRISDVLTLRKADFNGSHIRYKCRKTKRWLATKLPKKALSILKSYSQFSKNPDDLIFPFLNNDIDWKDKEDVFKVIGTGTATYNLGLKKVALKAKIKKKLHSHIARHTFATLGLSKGIPSEHVQKMLGHKDIKTTFGYAKFLDKDLDRSMEKFDN